MVIFPPPCQPWMINSTKPSLVRLGLRGRPLEDLLRLEYLALDGALDAALALLLGLRAPRRLRQQRPRARQHPLQLQDPARGTHLSLSLYTSSGASLRVILLPVNFM